MTTGSPRIQRWKISIFRVAAAISLGITEPSARVELKQRRHIRLLAAFLILMAINTLIGSVILKNIGGNSWVVLLVTSVALIVGYFITRTRYYRAALVLAVTIPAVPPLAIAIFKPPEINLTAELMWLAMPLIVSSLLLAVRQTIILALFYVVFIIVLGISGLMGLEVLAPVMGYISIITFFVITINVFRRNDQSEIENQLNERQEFEKTLRESEEKFRNLFEYAKDAIVIADAETGILIDINPAGCRLVGLPKERIVGKHQSILHPPELAERYKQVFRGHVEKGVVITDDILVQHADGSQIQCDISTSVFKLGDKQIIQGVFRDVSERKQMEKASRESEEKFSKAFHASPDAMSISRLSDGVFLEVNESYTRSSGYTREEIVGHNADEFDMWANAEQREIIIQKQRNHIKMRNQELQTRSKSGEIHTQLISSEYVHIGDELCLLVVSTDITERKKMEESLVNEATRRRILIEQSSDGIVILDQNGAVYEANRRFAEMLGYSPEEVLKLHVWDWDTQWAPEQLLELIKTVDEAGDHLKTYHRRKDGTTFDVEISTNGTMFSGQKLVFCVCRDISERNRMEKALRESEEKFSIAFRSSPVTIAITTLKDGKYVEVNDSYIRSTGYTSEELISRSSTDVNIWAKPEDRTRFLKLLKKQGRVANEEFNFRMKSGEIRTWLFSAEHIDIAGEPCVLGVSVDITDRKKVEEALREREKRFSDIAGNAMEWIWEVDTKGKYTYSSPIVEKILGYKPEEVLEKHFYDFFLPEEREELRKAAFEAFAQKQPIKEFINRNRCKNGKTIELLTSGVPVINEEGNLLGYRGVDTDITERRQAEQALKESEEKFSVAFRSSPEMIAIANLQTGKYIEVNDSYLSVTGYNREEIIGHQTSETMMFVHPEDSDKMVQLIKEHGKIRNEEYDFRMKSGDIRRWLCSAEVFTLGGDQCIISVATDITERKKMEEALQESEEKFSIAFRSSPEMIIITDIENNKYLEINDSYINAMGYSREEMMSHSVDYFEKVWVNPEELKKTATLLQTQGKMRDEEFNFRTKSGEILHWLCSADIVTIGGKQCMLAVATDITERKHMEKALQESEEKFSKAFNASPNTIVIISLKDRKIIETNENYALTTGYTREELIGHNAADFNSWVDDVEHKRILKILEKEGHVHGEEVYLRKRTGEIHVALLSIELVNISGEPCMLAESIDITRLKQTEKKLKEAMADLEQSSAKLTATNKELETFSYSVSHDLRSPLRSIDGFSQALLEDYQGKIDETGQDYLRRLRGASQKMGELIDGILKLSRLTRSEMHHEPIDLSALAEEIANRLQETQPERRVKFVIGKELTANGDPQLLRVLLENLLGNAWKFTGKNPHAKIEFSVDRNNGKKAYFIKDNGAGFDMTYADKLFGAFQRLHEATDFPGTGIGLATVQRIINRHGGTIWAEGAVGKGATFHFTLD